MIFFKKLKKHLKTSENSSPIQKEKKRKKKIFCAGKVFLLYKRKEKRNQKYVILLFKRP